MNKFGIMVFIFIAFALAFIAQPIKADQQSQITNQIYLSPFYREAMSNGIVYNYTLSVNPPDRIGTVFSAIISFDVFITPSVNFSLRVNNRTCNIEHYYISTTYSGVGQTVIRFDCSNIITQAGIYNITLRPTLASIGASVGWLDMSYTNNPEGSLTVHGTEYSPYQNGTVFIGLYTPVNVTSTICNIKIWYPNLTFFASTLMTYLNTSDSLFYYNFVAPITLGVYMTEAKCYVPVANRTMLTFYASLSGDNLLDSAPNPTSEADALGTIGTNAEVCNPDSFQDTPTDFGGNIFQLQSVVNHTLRISADATRSATVRIKYSAINYDTNTVTNIGFTLVNISATSTTTQFTMPNFTANYNFSLNEVLFITPCITNLGGSTTFTMYYGGTTPSNFTRLTNAVNLSQAFIYRGTGEIHITDLNLSNIANAVWTYSNRTFTDNNNSAIYNLLIGMNQTLFNMNTTVNQIQVSLADNFSKIYNNFTAIQVWESRYFLVWNNTIFPQFGNNFTDINGKLINQSHQLNYTLNNLSFILNNATQTNQMALYWNNTLFVGWDRNFTIINQKLDGLNSTMGFDLNSTMNSLSYILGNVSSSNLILLYWNDTLFVAWNNNFTTINQKLDAITLSQSVNFTNIFNNLTSIEQFLSAINSSIDLSAVYANLSEIRGIAIDANNTIYSVKGTVENINTTANLLEIKADNINATVTFMNMTVNDMNATMPYRVWTFNVSRTLTDYNLSGLYLVATQINETVNYINFSVSNIGFNLTNLTAEAVWSYSNGRTLTDYNMSGINMFLISINDSVYFTHQDILAINQTTPASVWDYSLRSLTDYNLSEIKGMLVTINGTVFQIQQVMSEMNNTMPFFVWSYSSRLLTDYNNSQTFLFLTGINGTVYDINQTVHGLNNLSAQDVWQYANRSLSDYNNSEIISLIRGLANITSADVWAYSNRSLTLYNLSEIQGLLLGMSNLTAGQVWNLSNRTITFFDYETQALYVWNSTVNGRTLTYYNTTFVNVTASDIWSYSVRSLTDYNQSGIFIYLSNINNTVTDINNNITGISQTTTNIFNFLFRSNQSVVLYENLTNNILNSTASITIDYTIYIPEKPGFNATSYLPVKIKFWFLDANYTCMNQFNTTNSSPTCNPLEVQTLGLMLSNISFTASLRPQLPQGIYYVVREVQIDPNNIWISYSTEPIGTIQVTDTNTLPQALVYAKPVSAFEIPLLALLGIILVPVVIFTALKIRNKKDYHDVKPFFFLILAVLMLVYYPVNANAADLIGNVSISPVPPPTPIIALSLHISGTSFLTNQVVFINGQLYAGNGSFFDNQTIQVNWFNPGGGNATNITYVQTDFNGSYAANLSLSSNPFTGIWLVNVTDISFSNTTNLTTFSVGAFVPPNQGGGGGGGVVFTGGVIGLGYNLCGNGICEPGEEAVCLIDCGNVSWAFTPPYRILQLDKGQCYNYDFLVTNTLPKEVFITLTFVDRGDGSSKWNTFGDLEENGTTIKEVVLQVPASVNTFQRNIGFNVTTCVPRDVEYKTYTFDIFSKEAGIVTTRNIPIDVSVSNIPGITILLEHLIAWATTPLIVPENAPYTAFLFVPMTWFILFLVIVIAYVYWRSRKRRKK